MRTLGGLGPCVAHKIIVETSPLHYHWFSLRHANGRTASLILQQERSLVACSHT